MGCKACMDAVTSLFVAFTAVKRALEEIRATGTFTGLSAQDCVDARRAVLHDRGRDGAEAALGETIASIGDQSHPVRTRCAESLRTLSDALLCWQTPVARKG